MKVIINALAAKKRGGGGFQIAYNFIKYAITHPFQDIDFYYLISKDLYDDINPLLKSQERFYSVFPNQPDKKTLRQVQKGIREIELNIKPDLIFSLLFSSYFTFKTREVARFANSWITNTNKYVWESLSIRERIVMYLNILYKRARLRKCDFFVTQTETVKSGLIRVTGLSAERIKVVPNVLPDVYHSLTIPDVKKDNKQFNIIYPSAEMSHKNLEIIPEVIRIMRQKDKELDFVFHLTLPKDCRTIRKIEERCDAYHCKDYLVNHGRLSQVELAQVYSTCDACFLPSLLETFSATSLESMYFGLFIIASNFTFHTDVIGEAGIYFEPKDANDASDKIIQIIKSKALQENLCKKMKERIRLYDNYDSYFSETVNFLKSITSNK